MNDQPPNLRDDVRRSLAVLTCKHLFEVALILFPRVALLRLLNRTNTPETKVEVDKPQWKSKTR